MLSGRRPPSFLLWKSNVMLSSASPFLCWGWVGDAKRVLLPRWYVLGVLGVQTSGQTRDKLRLRTAVGRAAKPCFSQLSLITNPTCSDQRAGEARVHGCRWAEVPPRPGEGHFLCCGLRGWCDDVLSCCWASPPPPRSIDPLLVPARLRAGLGRGVGENELQVPNNKHKFTLILRGSVSLEQTHEDTRGNS